MPLIVFDGETVASCLLALRDTLGPGLAEEACLLFTEEGSQGKFLNREQLLRADLSTLRVAQDRGASFRAIIRAQNPERALARLQLMAGPIHGYGKQPRLVSEPEREQLIREAGEPRASAMPW